MTTAGDSPRSRAAAELGVATDADRAAVRSAMLSAVTAEGFAPRESCVTAWNLLAEDTLPVSARGLAVEGMAERAEVDVFASAYWSLGLAERNRRWKELSARYRTGPSAVFLSRLERGLFVADRTHADELVSRLSEVVRELFVLRMRARSIHRGEWLAEHGSNVGWHEAAQVLSKSDPATARLDPGLLERLRWRVSNVSVAGLPEESLTATPHYSENVWSPPAGVHSADAAEEAATRRRNKQKESSGGSWGLSGGGWAAGFLVMVLMRACISLGGGSSTSTPNYQPYQPSYTPPPSFKAPAADWKSIQEAESKKRRDELFKRMEPPGKKSP